MPEGREPTEAEVRAYLEQLRAAPVEAVVAEVAEALLSAVQVKLGRPDGRLLIDAAAALASALEGRIDAALHGQIAAALAQLRLAQVELEGGQGVAAEEGGSGPGASGTDGTDVPPAPPAPGPPGAGSAASRLWVPGR
jgi:hypothetical protein